MADGARRLPGNVSHLQRLIASHAVPCDGQSVVLDFSNVAMVSPSFADELFAKMPHDAWDSPQLSVEHLDDSIARFAKFLIASRD